MRKKKFNKEFLYIIPFASLILFTTLNFSTGNDSTASAGSFTMLLRMSIYALALYPFFSNPTMHIPWLLKRWPLIIMFVFVSMSALWSAYPQGVLESVVHFAGGAFAAYAASIYFSNHHGQIFPYLSVVLAIPVLVSLFVVYFMPEVGLQDFKWEEVTRWRGSTGNANSLGRISALAIWTSVICLVNNRENKKLNVMRVFIIIASIATLMGSDSKTSQITCLFLLVLVFLAPKIVGRNKNRKRKQAVFLAYLGLILVTAYLIYPTKNISEDQALSKVGRNETYSGRTYLWEDASILINMKPIIGWSFDGRRSAMDKIDIGVPHFHNGYLDIMVRGGLVGGLILIVLLARMAWRLYKKSRHRPYIYSHLSAFFVVSLIYNITEVSFGAWSDISWIMLLLIYFLTERSSRRRRRRSHGFRAVVPEANRQGTVLDNLLGKLKKRHVFVPLLLVIAIGVVYTLGINSSMSGHTDKKRTSENSVTSEGKGDKMWRSLVFAPEFKQKPDEYLTKFEKLVTDALVPLGINLIIFDMHWNNYSFSHVPGLRPLNKPPFGAVTAKEARKLAEICRRNGIKVMVGMNFLTHQNYGQLLKAYPKFAWPGNDKLWNPLNPEVNKIAFMMADELIDAFDAEGFHIGMDEGWGFNVENLPGSEGFTTPELFSKAINEYHEHFVNEKKVELLMWSDMLEGRYEDAPVMGAISTLPKDIILVHWDYKCHWKHYPGIGQFVEKFLPICPWDGKELEELIGKGFRVMVSPWKNPRAAKKLAMATKELDSENIQGILYTTWSSEVVDSLREALLGSHSKGKPDPTISGVAESIRETIDMFNTASE